jgi:hypothetical protein
MWPFKSKPDPYIPVDEHGATIPFRNWGTGRVKDKDALIQDLMTYGTQDMKTMMAADRERYRIVMYLKGHAYPKLAERIGQGVHWEEAP